MNQTQDQDEKAKSQGHQPDDSRVIQALDDYLTALEEGRKPDRSAFLAAHAEIGDALAKCLDGLEFVQKLAPELSQSRASQAPAPATPTAEIQPEGPLGDFRIVREIGRGGMGVVYEAVQISLGRRVALKVLPFAAAMDAKQLQRFKNEAQAAAHLQHTHIVPVHYVGCERGVHFYAMQYIEGQTLAAIIRELRHLARLDTPNPEHPAEAASALASELASGRWGPSKQPGGAVGKSCAGEGVNGPSRGHSLPSRHSTTAQSSDATAPATVLSTQRSSTNSAFFRTIAHLGVQAAEALEHAHQLGIIHRDIKPANLLIDSGGRLWVTDFGLAHCRSQPGLTMTGDLVGTLRYMSPEQALAKRVAVDARTDIYSLGVTLYEMLTLEPAYNGRDREEVLRQIAFEEPRPLHRLNRAIPAELETIVQKAIAKSPEERFVTAQELADDLRRFLEHKPIRAKRPTLLQKTSKWCRRNPLLAGALTAVAASLVLAAPLGAQPLAVALTILTTPSRSSRIVPLVSMSASAASAVRGPMAEWLGAAVSPTGVRPPWS